MLPDVFDVREAVFGQAEDESPAPKLGASPESRNPVLGEQIHDGSVQAKPTGLINAELMLASAGALSRSDHQTARSLPSSWVPKADSTIWSTGSSHAIGQCHGCPSAVWMASRRELRRRVPILTAT